MDDGQGTETLDVGLVGAGYWGQRHARVLEESSHVARIRLWDRDGGASARLIGARGKSSAATSLEHCLDGCDAVVICSPAATHFDLARLCVSRGIPTLVEKPLAVSLEQSVQPFRAASESGCFLGAGHQYEHHAGVGTLRGWFDAGRFGGALRIGSTRRGGLARTDTDVLLDLAVHDVAALNRIVGAAPTHVEMGPASRHPNGLTSAATFSLTYPAGHVATVRVDWDGPRERCLCLEGPEGTATLDETLPPGRQLSWTSKAGATERQAGPWLSPLEAQGRYFLRMARINRFSEDEERRVLAVMRVVDLLHEQIRWRAPPSRAVER